jgi:hypothetical protein
MKKLKEERRSTKYKQNYHILVLSKIVDEFKPVSLDDIRQKVNAYLLLIGTTFQNVPADVGFFTREAWIEVCGRIEQMLELIWTETYGESLVKAQVIAK